jgi:hypothetical protein
MIGASKGAGMAQRQQDQWGGDVQMPGWLRRLLRRPDPVEDTPEAAHERRRAQPSVSVAQNANRAELGPLVDLYREGRQKRR